jgi:Actinobacteria/chloroflexi VLRF1 release factor
MKNPAAGGGRWVEVPPERFVSWIVTFAERHGGADGVAASRTVTPAGNEETVTFSAADGAAAECHPPFPSAAAVISEVREAAEALAADAAADRTVGVLLVRLGGYAVGVFSGAPPRLMSSKTGSRPVHGRSAAGGWSQQRFSRRRENQAATAVRAAADAAAEVFGPYGPAGLDAVVLGGDKRSAAGLREDPRLAGYLARAAGRFLTVPDPRLAVLRDSPRAFQAIRIRLTEPQSDGPVPG